MSSQRPARATDLLVAISRNAPRDVPLVVDAEGSTDVERFLERVDRAAAALLGEAKTLAGRRVGILAPPGASFLVALFGAFHAGAAVVVLSPLHPPPEMQYFLDHAGVDTLVVDRSHASLVAPLVTGADGLERRLLTIDELHAGTRRGDPPGARPDDDALILYTSGTTARPKGARITHDNLATQSALLREAWRWSPGDRLLHALPLHHLHGLGIALLTALSAGAGVHVLPRFDAHAMWEAIAVPASGLEDREPVLMSVPTIFSRMLGTFEAAEERVRRRWTAGARTLRLATSGSAALGVTLSARFSAIAGEAPLERFGMTEIGVGTAARIGGPRIAGSAGVPLPTVEVRVVDDTLRDVAPGEEGELLVRGPSVFPGYDGDDAASRAAFPFGRDEGWFRTGDAVVFGDDGEMRVRGRLSVDVLKSGGYKISALEIEDVLRAHPDLVDVAVVGLPDPEWGDLVTAVVVSRAGCTFDEDALRTFCRERLAAYKVPKRFVAMEALPRNVVGKVVKPALALAIAPAIR